jgi:transcriptional regulator with XRE-family HTH domain
MRLPDQTWAELLTEERVCAGLSIPELARTIGVSPDNVWRWEHAERPIPALRRRQIAGALNMSEDEVFPTTEEGVAHARKRIADRWKAAKRTAPVPVADRLSAHMEAEGLSHQAIADLLGVHQSTVSRWLTGRYEPAQAQRAAIEAKLGLPAGQRTLSERWEREIARREQARRVAS